MKAYFKARTETWKVLGRNLRGAHGEPLTGLTSAETQKYDEARLDVQWQLLDLASAQIAGVFRTSSVQT